MPKTALDPYFAVSQDLTAPARYAATVVTGVPAAGQVQSNDTTDLPQVTKMIYVNVTGAGNLAVIMPMDPDPAVVAIPLAVGTYQLPLQVRRIMQTLTTITGTVVVAWGG